MRPTERLFLELIRAVASLLQPEMSQDLTLSGQRYSQMVWDSGFGLTRARPGTCWPLQDKERKKEGAGPGLRPRAHAGINRAEEERAKGGACRPILSGQP